MRSRRKRFGEPALLSFVTAGVLALGHWSPATGGAADDRAVVNSIGMRMVLIPAGTFVMGSPFGERMRQEEERPHHVTLTKAFRISATEVTQQQWQALMGANRGSQEAAELPVASVSWADARQFCRELSQKEKTTYRLPTEAEWEYACRAGSQTRSADLEVVAWYAENSEDRAHAVATRAPNAWGLFDMLGNVSEWTADVYSPYARVDEQPDPTGPETGGTRVVRGGSFRSFPPALRCAARTGTPPSYQLPHVGFRVIRLAP
jgi:formylglycine-generating enzyme required for sulfatase activity